MTILADPLRLAALRATQLLDTPPEPSFDRLTRLAARVLGAPVVLVSLVDDRRQFFKSAVGLAEPLATRRETPLSHSFCQHVVTSSAPLVVVDARADPLVRDNAAVPDLGVVAYAGVPLQVDGQDIGAFCAIDIEPRAWSAADLEVLRDLAHAVVTEIGLRTALRELRDREAVQRALFESSAVATAMCDAEQRIVAANPAYQRLLGYTGEQLRGMSVLDLSPPEERERERDMLTQAPPAADGFHREKRFRRADGSEFTARVSNALIRGEDGQPRFRTAMIVDVTEVLRARAALVRSEATHAAIVRNLPDGAVLMVDRDLRYVAAGGPALPRILEIARIDGLLGKTVHEVAGAESRDAIVKIYGDAVAGKEQRLEVERAGRVFEMRAMPLDGGALIFLYDITERKRAHDMFATTLERLEEGVALLDGERRVLLANHACSELLGLPRVIGLSLDETAPAAAGGDEILVLKPRRRILRRTLAPVALASGPGEVAVWRDVTAERDLAAERERELLTDALTGIPNRRAADRALDVELSRKSRTGSPLSVALLDVDHFKKVNDQHGHGAGDEVLRRVATTVAAMARKTDVVARWGGEELLAILPVALAGARVFCERARAAVAALETPGVGRVTLSAGAAEVADGEPVTAALARADARLYEAKGAGRNCVR